MKSRIVLASVGTLLLSFFIGYRAGYKLAMYDAEESARNMYYLATKISDDLTYVRNDINKTEIQLKNLRIEIDKTANDLINTWRTLYAQ